MNARRAVCSVLGIAAGGRKIKRTWMWAHKIFGISVLFLREGLSSMTKSIRKARGQVWIAFTSCDNSRKPSQPVAAFSMIKPSLMRNRKLLWVRDNTILFSNKQRRSVILFQWPLNTSQPINHPFDNHEFRRNDSVTYYFQRLSNAHSTLKEESIWELIQTAFFWKWAHNLIHLQPHPTWV